MSLQEQFSKAYKVNFPSLFCQITAVFRLSINNQYMNHTSILTVRKDGADIEDEVTSELELYKSSGRYSAVDFVKLI